MRQISEVLGKLLPPSREKQALKAFVFTAHSFIVSNDHKTPSEIVEYSRQIEPTTGLMKKILLARAASDLCASDGLLGIFYERLGQKPLASFFEFEIDHNGEKRTILGIDLNLDAPIKNLRGGDLYLSIEDSYSVVNALVEAEVVIDSRIKRGEDKVILRRSQMDKPIREFIGI